MMSRMLWSSRKMSSVNVIRRTILSPSRQTPFPYVMSSKWNFIHTPSLGLSTRLEIAVQSAVIVDPDPTTKRCDISFSASTAVTIAEDSKTGERDARLGSNMASILSNMNPAVGSSGVRLSCTAFFRAEERLAYGRRHARDGGSLGRCMRGGTPRAAR
jgi:hypothetical protein